MSELGRDGRVWPACRPRLQDWVSGSASLGRCVGVWTAEEDVAAGDCGEPRVVLLVEVRIGLREGLDGVGEGVVVAEVGGRSASPERAWARARVQAQSLPYSRIPFGIIASTGREPSSPGAGGGRSPG